MGKKRPQFLALGMAISIGISVLILSLALANLSGPARADTLCVKPGGSDGCLATINAALAVAQENDTIRVAAGVYSENVLISQTVTLQGGWAPDFSVRDLDAFSSTIRPADNTQSVVSIQGQFADPAAVAPTLDGFVVTGGRADLGSNHGGGLAIRDSNALVISNTIRDNAAFLLGGGVWVQRGAPLLQDNQILDNLSVGLGQDAHGGGVQLENSQAALLGNMVVGNVVSGTEAYGGGIEIAAAAGISVTLSGNLIQLNATDGFLPQNGFGGGIAISGASTGQVILTNNQVISNAASIDTDGDPDNYGFGGGVFLGSAQAQLAGNHIVGNWAGHGGGIALTCVNPGTPEEDCWNVDGHDNVFRQNSADQGGGIFLSSVDACCTFSGANTQIQDNEAMEGGGLYNDGQFVALRGGLIISNTAQADGGGLWISAGGTISLTHSAAIANVAGQDGGAILNSGVISITNTTVSGNSADGMGGGIANLNVVELVNATVSDNASADGAGFFNANMVNAVNSLIALNIGDNCLGVLNSLGHNLEDGGTCALGQPTDMSNTPPSMDPVGDNGGPTPTHALADDSPAIDAGDNAACAAVDQRGVARPLDGDGDGQAVCDVGAYEFQPPTTAAILSDEPDPSKPGEPFTVTVSVTSTLGAPTGAVTVTVSDDPGSCSEMLAGGIGYCSLTLSLPGTYTLTAAYVSGDDTYASSSDMESHVVEVGGHHVYLPLIRRD